MHVMHVQHRHSQGLTHCEQIVGRALSDPGWPADHSLLAAGVPSVPCVEETESRLRACVSVANYWLMESSWQEELSPLHHVVSL